METSETAERHEDEIWCSLRGVNVPVSECVDGCAAPEMRPVCWLPRRATLTVLADSHLEPDGTRVIDRITDVQEIEWHG